MGLAQSFRCVKMTRLYAPDCSLLLTQTDLLWFYIRLLYSCMTIIASAVIFLCKSVGMQELHSSADDHNA